MKKVNSLTLVISLLTSFSINVSAQNEPNKPSFEKRVYLNNGNTYVQKQMPLYLKFSTEPNGKNYDLKSKSTAEYADPMYLDTEGINYIRSRWAVDKESKKTIYPQQEIMFEVYADGLAPNSKSQFINAPAYNNGSIQFYGKGLSVDLSAKDWISGVENIHYSTDGEAYKNYTSSINYTEDKAYTLYYFANDYVGNAEKTNKKVFTVDVSSPISSDELVGTVYQNNIISPSTKFKLSSSDELSGVSKISYKYDSRSENTYPGYSVSVSYLSDGEHTIYYHAIDKVKNDEEVKSFKFYLDKIAPEVTITVEGDQYETSNRVYVSSRTKVNMTATDNKAGVESIQYNINGSGYNTFGSPFPIPNTRGTHNIVYYAIDNVKNRTTAKSVVSTFGNREVYMDNRAPTTGISYSNPKFFDRDTLFINSKTNVILNSSDNASGVQKTEYALDGGSFSKYSSTFNISNEGYHTIKFKTTDKVNNVEQEKESNVFVDNTPPDIYHNFSIKPIGTKKNKGQEVNIYPNYSRLYLGATDAHCGTEEITYSLNGSEFYKYSSPHTLDISEVRRFGKNKFYTAVVRAIDKLGNQSEETIYFYIGE
jgi:hypothetical protein